MTIFEIIEHAQANTTTNRVKKLNGTYDYTESTTIDIIEFIKDLIKDEILEISDLFEQSEIDEAATKEEE